MVFVRFEQIAWAIFLRQRILWEMTGLLTCRSYSSNAWKLGSTSTAFLPAV
jgi:hypothetical protein